MTKSLSENKEFFIKPLYFTKTHHYTSYLSRTINLSNLNNSDKSFYFREIKNALKSQSILLKSEVDTIKNMKKTFSP